jgi:tetrahydromethanopterin S-methyltransferase subunit A
MDNEKQSISQKQKSPMMALMRVMGRLMPTRENGENPTAVKIYRLVNSVWELISGKVLVRSFQRLSGRHPWPIVSGGYVIGDRVSPVAVCTLTNGPLNAPMAHLAGVAIAGQLRVPNLGIEKIIRNITGNRNIRFLILCGKESSVFYPGQAMVSLMSNGVDSNSRIIGATGPMPLLANLSRKQIEIFRAQIELIDCMGTIETAAIETIVNKLLGRNPGEFESGSLSDCEPPSTDTSRGSQDFVSLSPGGKREPLDYDTKGFFVISLDQAEQQIVLHHYYPDNSPAHEIRGKSADAIFRTVLREKLVSNLSHAGYIGAELAKAAAALRLNLHYEQDKPLKL